MGRPFNADAKATWRTIHSKGIMLLFKHGFEAMNLRQLAADAGLTPGSLYNYFDSKSQFLSMILCGIMENILADLEKSVAPVQEARERLRKFIEFHIEWHTARRVETFIGSKEMRSLSKHDYKKYTELRKRYENFVKSILEQGVAENKFVVADVSVTTFAVLDMLTGTHAWYKAGGRLTQGQISEIYVDLVFRMIDVEHQAPRAGQPERVCLTPATISPATSAAGPSDPRASLHASPARPPSHVACLSPESH
ncbi:TetR/AcrR family transcriptional regulator [Ramlibacter lithotrophicus]|nr:TetR/AcrR family transcriptional regulator [Ramlibacter lithotrophicus]